MKFTEQEYERCRIVNEIDYLKKELESIRTEQFVRVEQFKADMRGGLKQVDDGLSYIGKGISEAVDTLRSAASDKNQCVESLSVIMDSVADDLERML